MRPAHPGDLIKDNMIELNMEPHIFAKEVGIHVFELHNLYNHEVPLSESTAKKLAHYFGTSVEMWMDIQRKYEEYYG